MSNHIPASEIVFSARYLHKGKAALQSLPDDTLDLYLRSIPKEYQEMNRRKDPADLRLAACYWRHWIYSKEEAEALGYAVDIENRVGGLYALALIESIKVDNDFQPVEDLGNKYGFVYTTNNHKRPEDYDIENIHGWNRINKNAILAFAGDHKGIHSGVKTTFWGSVGILWAPERLVKKYQPNSLDSMPLHLV
jgi:hypothetical protein